MAMEREPSRNEAYHELAAALQSVGRTDQAIDVIVEYRNKHGDLPEAVEDEKILRSSRRQTDAGEMDSASTAADPSRD